MNGNASNGTTYTKHKAEHGIFRLKCRIGQFSFVALELAAA